MPDPLEKALALGFLIIGLSHVLHGKRWAAFFEPLFRNSGGPFVIAMFTLPLGLLIVVTHNVWTMNLSVLVTLYGWASLVKGSLYFLCPALPERVVTEKIRSPRHFAVAGSVLMILGLLMVYDGFFAK